MLDFFAQYLTPKVTYYLTTLFATAFMYIFALHKQFKGATTFLQSFFPGRSPVFYTRGDFLLVVVAGSVIGTIFFHPSDPFQALAAGFGWVGALNILTTKKGGQ